ncbi:MAG: ABC transporter ATP-binding protein [Bacillota bacterium]|nr:ABC transporter ATP-binding protein [Bacillota bacterium]
MISIKNVEKEYSGFKLNLSMEIPKGTITGLVGKNGAGKSTTIKLILGLVKPDCGEVIVLDKNQKDFCAKDKLEWGVCLSEASFSKELTVQDIYHILKKSYKEFEDASFLQKCRELKLPMNKKVREFSTGMKAKVKLLVAITHKAKLLILDEPTAGLDVEARMDVLNILREYILEDEERSILITSHISSDLESLCDNIYLIHDGKIILKEDTDVILDQYGILKLDDNQLINLDKEYILKTVNTSNGVVCFTNQRQYYQENYPNLTIEKSGIDNLILMMTGGYR